MTGTERHLFRLFVAGDAANSSLALTNLRAICRANLADQFDIEVVDVFREPRRALADAVFMTPTVIKLAPSPVRRVVGTLANPETVRNALGFEAAIA